MGANDAAAPRPYHPRRTNRRPCDQIHVQRQRHMIRLVCRRDRPWSNALGLVCQAAYDTTIHRTTTKQPTGRDNAGGVDWARGPRAEQ